MKPAQQHAGTRLRTAEIRSVEQQAKGHAHTIMTRLAAVACGAALVASTSAFTLSSVPAIPASRGCRRSRACSASHQQPSMVASMPRTVPETGTKAGAASKQRLHVQVRFVFFSLHAAAFFRNNQCFFWVVSETRDLGPLRECHRE